MPTLSQLRSQLPELNGLDDNQALDVIHQVYYPTVDKGVIAGKLGVKLATPVDPKADGDFVRGLKKAAYQIPQTAGGAVALVGDAVGSEGLRDYGLGVYQNYEDKIGKITKDSDSLSNVLQGDADGVDWAQNAAGYVTGQLASAVATGGVGGFIGKQLALRGIKSVAERAVESQMAKQVAEKVAARGIKYGAGAALGASNLTQEAGSIYPDAVKQATEEGRTLDGGDLARIAGSAAVAAGVDTAMEGVMAGRLLNGGRKAGEGMARAALREVPGGMAREGITEGIQTGIERYGAGQDLSTADAIRDYVDSAGVGALGGGMGGAAAILHAQKVPESGPLSRAANVGIEQQILQLQHDPQPLISFPDGSVGYKQDLEAYLTQFPEGEERTRRRREIMGRDPETGKRPAPAPEPTVADNAANEEANMKAWGARHDGVPLDYAQALIAAPGAPDGLMIVPHPSGKKYTVVPSKWLTLDSQAKYAALQKGDAGKLPGPDREAPGGAIRVDSEGGAAPETYGEQARTAQIARNTIYNPKGEPFKTKFAAKNRMNTDGLDATHDIVPVEGGFVLQPKGAINGQPAAVPENVGTVGGRGDQSAAADGSDVAAGGEQAGAVSGQEPPPVAAAGQPAAADPVRAAGGTDAKPALTQGSFDFDAAAHEAATSPTNDLPEPTEAQKHAGNYAKGHVKLHGMDISIENPAGSVRKGVSPDGKAWENTLVHHYGYIRRTEGADGDHVDAFIGPNPESGKVFVVDQVDPKTGKFDEHKVLLGFDSAEEAQKGYAANYEKGWKGGKVITETDVDGFKAWLKDGDTTKPFAPQQSEDGSATIYSLPDDAYKDWLGSGARSFQPNPRQKLVMDAVEKALDDGAFYNKDVADRVAAALGVDAETRKRNNHRVDGGDFGYDVYQARDAVKAKRGHAEMDKVAGALSLKVGDHLGTLIFNDFKVNTSATVEAIDGTSIELKAKRGAYTAQMKTNPIAIKYAMERAHEKGKRKDSYEDFIAAKTKGDSDVRTKTAQGAHQEEPQPGAARQEAAKAEPAAAAAVEPAPVKETANAAEPKPGPAKEVPAPKAKPKALQERDRKVAQKAEGARKPKAAQPDTTSEAEKPAAPIGDFGEKLHGARKDLWASFKHTMQEDLPADVRDITVAKHFPEPNYEALLDEGVDVKVLAALKAMRDQIPAKPRVGFKVRAWGEKIKTLRELANHMLDGDMAADQMLAEMRKVSGLRDFADRIQWYAKLGYPLFTKAKDFSIEQHNFTVFNGTQWPGGILKYELTNAAARGHQYFDTLDQAVDAVRAKLEAQQETGEKGKAKTKLDLYRLTGSRDIIIGKKVGPGKFIDLKTGLKTVTEARAYLAEHEDELLALLEKKKDVRPERRSVNDPRVGIDRRKGEDVTPEKFADTFGFRGVQFGNYVEQKRRATDLNNAYDALLDMADLLGLPPRALSLNGTLGLAFGARGSGGKNAPSAHFEPGQVVINLTKANGAGSLAHEWSHGLDNYFERMRGVTDTGHVTDQPVVRRKTGPGGVPIVDDSVRPEVLAAFKQVMDAIRASGMVKRSKELDGRRTKDYWSTGPELFARAFESYVIDKAAEHGNSNDYLANIVSEEAHEAMNGMLGDDQPFPYPTKAEKPSINAAFDQLFQTIEARPQDNGNLLLASVNKSTFYSDKTIEVDGKRRPVTNSKGQLVAPTAEGQIAFWRWFGDSKAVDQQGRPRVYYHGTNADFDQFQAGDGFTSYFTPHEDVASDHAEFMVGRDGGNAQVKPVYLRIERPAVLSDTSGIGYEPGAIDELKAQGHDGIVADDDHEVIVFSPEQIKSATGNNGEFSRDTADITAMAGQSTASPMDAQIAGMVKEGASVDKVLEHIEAKSENADFRTLAAALRKLGLKTGILFERAKGTYTGGVDAAMATAAYRAATDTAYLHQEDGAEANALHELVHAATLKALAKGGLAATQMKALWNHIKSLPNFAGEYGITNEEEFVAEAYTNPQFRAKLSDTPAPGGKLSLWQKLVGIVRILLGKPAISDNVLERVMSTGAKLMQENKDGAASGDVRASAEAFKRWFGNSKVVDANGQPLVVYHGTGPGEIREFKIPAFFTEDRDGARWYAQQNGDYDEETGKVSENIVESYLSIQNPLDITDKAGSFRLIDLARAAGVDVHVEEHDDGSWSFDAPGIADHSPYDGTNVPDLVYIPAVREKLMEMGYDGLKLEDTLSNGEIPTWVAFKPGQIKSADSNSGAFDPANSDLRASVASQQPDQLRATIGQSLNSAVDRLENVRLPSNYLVGDFLNSTGKISWWHKTIGTMDNLARRQPAFAPVYDAVQNFIGDVSRHANAAADEAQTWLPKLERLADIVGKDKKQAVSAADTKAVAAPVFEGTLMWARDEHGKPVRLADLEEKAKGLTTAQKAKILLQQGVIDDGQNQAWQANPLDFYDSVINRKYAESQLKAGVVWSDAELRDIFHLNEHQIGLYREALSAANTSLTRLAVSEMVKLGGKEAAPLMEQAINKGTVDAAATFLRDHFTQLARENPEQADQHLDTAKQIMDAGDRATDLMERGYFPLMRFGKYTVYVEQNGEQVYFGMFESKADAARMARQMKAAHPDAQVLHGTVSEEAYKLFAGVSPETIELFGGMVGLGQEDAASNEVYQAYLKLARNNRSAMKRLIQRKGIAGFSEDPARVLASFIYSNARLTSSNTHFGTIDEAVNAIPKQQGELKDAAVQLRNNIKSPEGGGANLGGLMFAQFLGGSVASAMVNLTQPVAMTLPYLSQFGGIGKAGARLMAAYRDAAKEHTGDVGLDQALAWATAKGIVSPQEIHALQAYAQGKGELRAGDGTTAGNARAALNNTMAKVRLGWGKLFALAEQVNRRVTFIAAYRTAVEEGKPNPREFAADAVSQTQGTYNAGNRPKWARNPVGNLLMTFKQYSITYLELLSRMAFAGEPGSPERAAGQRAALCMLAVLFVLSGADGLPFEKDLEDAIDGILQRLGYNFSTKRAKQKFLVDLMGQGGADFALKGISSMPGMPIDVSGRFGMGNLIPATGLLTKKESYTSDLGELAGPAGDIAKRAFTSTGKALGGDIGGAALDMMPQSVRNVAKGVDMLDTGSYNDARGYKVNDTTPTEAVMKMIGFQPNSTAQAQETKGEALDMLAQTRMRSKEIAEHWAQGLAAHDPAMVQQARDMLHDWNAKNPETPVKANLPSILRRVKAMREDAAARTEKTAPQALKQAVRRELKSGGAD